MILPKKESEDVAKAISVSGSQLDTDKKREEDIGQQDEIERYTIDLMKQPEKERLIVRRKLSILIKRLIILCSAIDPDMIIKEGIDRRNDERWQEKD